MSAELLICMDRLARACEADPIDLAAIRAARLEVDELLDAEYEDDPT